MSLGINPNQAEDNISLFVQSTQNNSFDTLTDAQKTTLEVFQSYKESKSTSEYTTSSDGDTYVYRGRTVNEYVPPSKPSNALLIRCYSVDTSDSEAISGEAPTAQQDSVSSDYWSD